MHHAFGDRVGRTETATQVVERWPVAGLCAALDERTAPGEGEPVPPAAHWPYFGPTVPQSEVGPDGHPRRGGFLAAACPAPTHAGGQRQRLLRRDPRRRHRHEDGAHLLVEGTPAGAGFRLWARDAEGMLSMTADSETRKDP